MMSTAAVSMHQLEAYAQLLLAPPNLVTNEQRNEAQQVFMDFQKRKQPFEICRQILEASNVSYVQFQAGSCLKNGVIRDWSYLKEDNRKFQLLTYLIEFVNSRDSLDGYVREQLLLVCAIILKRCGIDEAVGQPRVSLKEASQLSQPSIVGNIVGSLLSMLTTTSPSSPSSSAPVTIYKRFTTCSFLLAILNEYASSTRASDFGLPWIKHFEAKKRFETTHLKAIFSATLEALNHLLQGPDNVGLLQKSPDSMNLLLKLLQLLETIFTWNFDIITIISSQYTKHVDSIETPIFQPNIDWRDTLVNKSVMEFIFFAYISVRQLNQENLIHHSLQCLSQLSSLTGSIISNPKYRIDFINFCLTGALHVMANNFAPYEVVPVTSMLYRICLHLQNRDTIKHVDKETIHKFITLLSQLTCKLIMDCLKAEQGKDLEDEAHFDRYKQAVDNVCDGWMVLLQAIEKYERNLDDSPTDEVDSRAGRARSGGQELVDSNLVSSCTRSIFECYLRCHLSEPEGLRQVSGVTSAGGSDNDIQEFEEEDNVAYFDQLNAVGSLGRVDMKHAAHCLSEMLILRVNCLQSCLQSMAATNGNVESKQWATVNEDLHWLVMITTWTLTQSNYGERDLIPGEVMRLSIQSISDVNKTMMAIKACEPVGLNDGIDPVVRLLVVVFKLCKLEQYVSENNMNHYFSPQVSSTLASFVSRFMSGYLLPNENDYTDMSITLNACFGRDSPAAVETLNMLVDTVLTKIFTWSSESQLTEDAASSLVNFVQNSPERCKALIMTPSIEKLLVRHGSNQLHALSMQTRKNIYQLLVLMATHKSELWEQVFAPLRDRYQKIQQAMSTGDTSESTRTQLIDFCECLVGISAGSSPTNITSVWPNFLGLLYINEVPRLLDIFKNYNPVVVALLEFVSNATNRVLCFLAVNETLQFYEATINILNVYAKHNKGRTSRESSSDEETHNDVLVILSILNDLAAKDFIDWFPPGAHENTMNGTNGSTITATQVVFIGLNIVMPLMSPELLEFPKLSQNYYKLIAFLCEDPDRLQEVPVSLTESIMGSVQHALKSTLSSEIKCNCLSMVSILAGHCLREPNQFQPIAKLLEPFLGVIFEFILLECGSSKDVTLRENVANTLFMLICCFPETYNNLVQQMIGVHIQTRNEPALEEQLKKTFSSLMTDIPLSASRVHRSTFKQRFETFVTELQGLLCIK